MPQPKPPHAAVRHAPQPIKPPPIGPAPAPIQALALEKSNDIQNALTVRDVQNIRYFRKGELVWCALSPPVEGPHSEADAILFWPGLVDVVTTKAIAVPREDHGLRNGDVDATESASPTSSPKVQITWSVKQQTSYRVKLLATAHSCLLSDAELLPYLSYAPAETLLESLRDALPEALQSDTSRALASDPAMMSPFNPQDVTMSAPDRYKEAITPYTLAIQIASHIATYWSPTDQWEFKFTMPPPAPTPAETTHGHVPSLQDVINSTLPNGSEVASAPLAPTPDSDALAPTRSSARVAAHMQNITQMRYQGLWWGAERIWTDELVRLKLARCQFAPQGAQAVYPPAGPSKSTQEWNEENGVPNDDPIQGAGEKGMFMLITGVFVVDLPKADGEPGTNKECRASGMLYELVDEDWIDPAAPLQDGAVQTNHKGKARAQDGPGTTASISNEFVPQSTLGANANNIDPSLESASAPIPARKDDSLSSSILSRPVLTARFELPDPPQGYRFHAILPPDNECVLSLSLISGRYYPRLFKHPLLQPVVQKALEVPIEQGGLLLNKHLWSLEGLLPGVHQSMDPEQWKESRHAMFKDADAEARSLLLSEIRQQDAIRHEIPVSASAGPSSAVSPSHFPADVIMDDEGPLAEPSSISAVV